MRSGTRALTDVTGFGLAGHLTEVHRASGCGFALRLSDVPLFTGVARLFEEVQSSLQNANELALNDFTLSGSLLPSDARLKALADPQTSGGLLAAVPADRAAACLGILESAGYAAADIGEFVENSWTIEA